MLKYRIYINSLSNVFDDYSLTTPLHERENSYQKHYHNNIVSYIKAFTFGTI